MKELPCNVHLQFMDGLPAARYKSIILSSYQHCDEHATISNILMCTLHNFPVLYKARFSHTSTVTRLHSCSGEKYVYALRASCFYREINIFEHF